MVICALVDPGTGRDAGDPVLGPGGGTLEYGIPGPGGAGMRVA